MSVCSQFLLLLLLLLLRSIFADEEMGNWASLPLDNMVTSFGMQLFQVSIPTYLVKYFQCLGQTG